jgi:REP element-mobilizing transposase RayT
MFGDIVDGEMITNQYGTIVEECWNNIPHHFTNVELDAFVVMPNHFHGIICLMEPVGAIHESPLPTTPQQRRNMLLSKIIGRFKMMSAKEINILRNTMGTHIWQRNYYEHIIRSNKELQTIRTYIINNPAQWALDTEYNVIHTNTQL